MSIKRLGLWSIIAALIVYIALTIPDDITIPNAQGISEVWESNTPSATQTQRILFIGNSHTFVNNLPWMFLQIARSDKRNTTEFIVQAITVPGAWLKDTFAWPKTQEILRNGRWNTVVLQENSSWAMRQDWVDSTFAAALTWRRDIEVATANPVFYATWPRQEGHDVYKDPALIYYGKNFATMQWLMNQNTALLAEKLGGAPVVNAGNAWAKALLIRGMPTLYQPDGNHASMAGTYLTALLFYQHFTGLSVAESRYIPPGLSAQDAARIKQALQ